MSYFYALFKNSCQIQTAATSQQDDGTPYVVYSTPVAGRYIPCSLQPDSSDEAFEYMRETGKTTYRLYLPLNDPNTGDAIDIRPNYRVVIDSITYRVRGISRDIATFGQALKVALELET